MPVLLLLALLPAFVSLLRPFDGVATLGAGSVVDFPVLSASNLAGTVQALQCRAQLRTCGGRPNASRMKRGVQAIAITLAILAVRRFRGMRDDFRRPLAWLVIPPTPPPRPSRLNRF